MTDPDTPPSTPPPTVPPPEPPTTPPTNPPPGPGAPPEPPPLSDDGSPGAYGATAGAYNAPATGPSPGSPYASGPYASGVATPPQTLSLTSFIVGLASLVFFWVPVLGFLAAVAAIIIGFIARRREPAAPRWMWLVGIISGFAAALLSLLFLIPFLLFLAFGSVITTNIPIPSA